MPTPPTPPPRVPPAAALAQPARPPSPGHPASAAPSPTPTPSQVPPAQPSTPPKPHGELDRRTLGAARTFDVLLRNGQTWRGVRLVEMDSWSLLLDVPDQGRVLLPKHAVDAYLLSRPG